MKRNNLLTKLAASLAFLIGPAASSDAQGVASAAQAVNAPPDEIIELTPFVVDSTKDTGYQATSTLAGTRIRTDLRDLGSAISIVTAEFMEDTGATDAST
jgi:outer membrane receptor for ferric coprogen and ferric-rhodotorulic acid